MLVRELDSRKDRSFSRSVVVSSTLDLAVLFLLRTSADLAVDIAELVPFGDKVSLSPYRATFLEVIALHLTGQDKSALKPSAVVTLNSTSEYYLVHQLLAHRIDQLGT